MPQKRFSEDFPEIAFTSVLEKDCDSGLWKSIKDRRFTNHRECFLQTELLYQLCFDEGVLSFLQISAEFPKDEAGYAAISSLASQIIIANQEDRLLGEPERVTGPIPWAVLRDYHLDASGPPDDRWLELSSASWRSPGWDRRLTASLLWPERLYLEYREEGI